ncbi:MAG: hypothetical protein ACOYKA_06900 [Legionellaceae bacterium]
MKSTFWDLIFFFSLYKDTDLHQKAQKLKTEIDQLRQQWSNHAYDELHDAYTEFSLKSGITYQQQKIDNHENDSFMSVS